jgi:hypothetical protein
MLDNIYTTTSMAIPHQPRPENYGNFDLDPRWEIGEFKVGDVVECFQCLNGVMQPSKPDCGIISFVSGDTMSVCVGLRQAKKRTSQFLTRLRRESKLIHLKRNHTDQ